jgi:hypothetical protein
LSKEERDLLTLTLDFFTAKMKKEGTLSKKAKEFEVPLEAIYGMPQTPSWLKLRRSSIWGFNPFREGMKAC